MKPKSSGTYNALGVSATKDEVHAVVEKMDQGLFPGAFCKMLPDTLTGDPDYCIAMHADGAGTKSTLAYIGWKETGNSKYFRGIAKDSLIMNLDDLLCVGATDNFVLSNTIGRNSHRIPGEIIKEIIEGYNENVESLKGFGINVHTCGGETADVGDLVQTVIVDSTLTVRMKKEDVISCNNIQAGDVIVGLSSTGQASYETAPNSGIGSNGLTAARHEVFSKYYAEKYPETFSSTIPYEHIFRGKYKFEDKLNDDFTVGDAILSPTRTYAPIIKKILEEGREGINGIIHCTGGAQQKCRTFGKGIHYIKDSLFDIPDFFKLIQDLNYMDLKEMYKVFNMGHRMEFFCTAERAQKIIQTSKEFDIDAKIIGHCEKSTDENKNKVTIRSGNDTFSYI